MFNQITLSNNFSDRLENSTGLSLRANRLFARARRAQQQKALKARLRGASRRLLNLDEVEQQVTIRQRYQAGTRSVALDAIRGSANKSGDFDAEFYPMHDFMADRWVGLATAFQRGVRLPPVELIQVGDMYFVVDGHHRLSIMRAAGYCDVDAVVTVWEIA